MQRLLIRHAFSEANRNGIALAQPKAHLTPAGWGQAEKLQEILLSQGIDLNDKVATSTFRRTGQTAVAAGFDYRNIVEYPKLDEVETEESKFKVMRKVLRFEYPPEALAAAERILEDPPKETVWVSHALVIGSVCQLAGVQLERGTLPYCGIAELDI